VPTHIRAMCQWQVGSTAPRDAMQITPHFRVGAGIAPDAVGDWQDLCDDLADGLNTWADVTRRQLTVKLYEIPATRPTPGIGDPNRPKATAVRDVGHIDEAGRPRELALCLSFNGGANAPRERGRLYLPAHFVVAAGSLSARPDPADRVRVGQLVPVFTGLGGIDVDWIVWSPTRWAATAVERWYVDDEWDVQRRRGLRPVNRTEGTTTEA
jgi:hypothetical protein